MKLKRITSLLLLLTMLLTLAACGEKNQPSKDHATDPTDDGIVTEAPSAEGSTDAETPSAEAAETPAKALLKQFGEMSGIDQMSPGDIAEQLVSNPVLGFSPVVEPVEEGFLNGFSQEIAGFDEGAVFAPMIGSIPFIAYVFSVSDDISGFIQTLKDSADLRWNICTQADEMICEANGSKVLFVMSPTSFDD